MALLCVAGFFIPFHFETDALFYIHLMDASHLPIFLGLTLFAYRYWPWELVPRRRRLAAAGSMLMFSGAIEIIQPLTGRSESWTDLTNGVVGILIALLFLATRSSPTRWQLLLIPLTIAGFGMAFGPAWKESAGLRWRASHFPLLADFESDDELRLWLGTGLGNVRSDGTAVERSREHASHGEWSLRILTTTAATWPGVRILNGKQDWRGKENFAFDVWCDGPAFTLSIRIDDDFPHKHYQERFNDAFDIKPGWNHIAIPTAEIETKPKYRRLNLAAIQRTIFYVNEPKTEHTFFIDHLRLE